MINKIPVRLRLALGHTIWMGLIFSMMGVGIFRLVERSIYETIDDNLITEAGDIRDASFDIGTVAYGSLRRGLIWMSLIEERYNQQRNSSKLLIQIVDSSGKIRARTRNIFSMLPVSDLALHRAEAGEETYETFISEKDEYLRQVTLPMVINGVFTGELIQVATPTDSSIRVLGSVRGMLWIGLSLGFILSIAFGYLLTRWSLKPVSQITKAAATMSIHDLHMRLNLPPAKDELRELTQTLNEMLDRLEDAFIRLNRFPGDVSHELRTPLAVLKGEAELALRKERTIDQYKEALYLIVQETDNMSVIVEDLLLLARAKGNSIEAKWEEVNVDLFLEGLHNAVIRPFSERRVTLIIHNYVERPVNLSPLYFSLAIKNILINACKHSRRGSQVELVSHIIDNFFEIQVIDHGEGISQEAIPYIFDAFYRADTARNRDLGGVGIGLSLAQALIKMHHGDVEVASEVGKGAIFKVKIPLERSVR